MQYTVHEFGYEYEHCANDPYLQKDRSRFAFGEAHYFRSGRDAIKAIAREHLNLNVLIPALSCQSMMSPFTMNGQSVRFYRMNVDLSANVQSIKDELSAVRGNAILLYMSYLGIRPLDENQIVQLKAEFPNVVLIEDRTHNLLGKRQCQIEPDYTVASIRKWICLPDGGLLWSKRPMKDECCAFEENFFLKRMDAQRMKDAYLSTGDLDTKEEYRSVFSWASAILDEDNIPYGISEVSKRIIHSIDYERIAERRAHNSASLLNVLMDSNLIIPLQTRVGLSDLYVPIYVNDRDNIQKQLSERSIYCTILWPLSKEQRTACKVACDVEAHMLAVPCDQRYSESDMEFIGRNIVDVCSAHKYNACHTLL